MNKNVKTVATVLGAVAGGYLTASAPAPIVVAIGTVLLVLVVLALLPLADAVVASSGAVAATARTVSGPRAWTGPA